MLIGNIFRAFILAVPLLASACMEHDRIVEAPRITGETPSDVAASIARLKANLSPDRQVVFGHAVMTLTLVAPDKSDKDSVGNMTPSFARMVSGRSAEQIIQIAEVYRASIPMDRR